MYFEDLGYGHHECLEADSRLSVYVNRLAVGWLQKGKNFSRGKLSEGYLLKVKERLFGRNYYQEKLLGSRQLGTDFGPEDYVCVFGAFMRGFHRCDLCEVSPRDMLELDGSKLDKYPSSTPVWLGSRSISIPNLNERITYVAPSLNYRYIEAHNYPSPRVFIEAVMDLDWEKPRKHNGPYIECEERIPPEQLPSHRFQSTPLNWLKLAVKNAHWFVLLYAGEYWRQLRRVLRRLWPRGDD